MPDFILILTNVVLLLVIIAQMADKVISNREHNNEITKLTGALMSRNVFEYESVLKTQKEPKKQVVSQEPDEVDIEQADDKEFDRHIGIK